MLPRAPTMTKCAHPDRRPGPVPGISIRPARQRTTPHAHATSGAADPSSTSIRALCASLPSPATRRDGGVKGALPGTLGRPFLPCPRALHARLCIVRLVPSFAGTSARPARCVRAHVFGSTSPSLGCGASLLAVIETSGLGVDMVRVYRAPLTMGPVSFP